MESPKLPSADELLRNREDIHRSRALLLFLALLVACATVALMTQPGQAMTHKKKVLDCQLEVHQHTKYCYDKEGNLICGYADYVVHVHNDDCYNEDGRLVCQLPEIREHKHTDECFQEEKVLICGQEESEGHQHTDKCYEKVKGALICGLEETRGHKHTDKCYDKDGNLICGQEEEEPHKHTDECYEWTEELVCGQEESEGHKHTDACYEVQKVPVCGELELHEHNRDCYDKDGDVICGQIELLSHVHGPECFKEVELTEEEVAALNGQGDEAPAGQDQTEAQKPENGDGAESADAAPDADLTANSTDASSSAESSAGKERPEDEKTITKVYRDKEIEVTAEYTAAANLPEEAELRVRLATKEDIAAARKGEDDAEEEDDEDSLFYVIGFYVGDREIEPEAPVTVKMHFLSGQFKDEEILTIEHYAKKGKEEFTAQTQQDEEGNAEAAFTTSSFSVYKVSAARSQSGQLVTEDTEIPNCGVEGCMGKCNITWTVCSDGSAKIGFTWKYGPHLQPEANYYHLHDKVYYNGVWYEVKDIEKIDNASKHVLASAYRNRPLKGKTVEIDDGLAARMVGNSRFSFSDIESIPSDAAMEREGFEPGEANSTADTLMWKKAGYNSESNQAEITLDYYQKVKDKPPVDLVFVYDDTTSMWDCCSTFSNNGCSATAAMYQRMVILAACRMLMEDNPDARVGFAIYTKKASVASPCFYSEYSEAKAWVESHFLERDCTDYKPGADAARGLIESGSGSGRVPAVVWISDFKECLNRNDLAAAQSLREAAAGGVYTISFNQHCGNNDYGYSNKIATIDSDQTLPYRVGCCHSSEYDPTHMFLARDMSDIFLAMETIIKELMGYYISWDTAMWDELSPGVNALELVQPNGEGDGYGERYASSGSNDPYAAHNRDLLWLFVENQQRLQAGKLYEHRFAFQLENNKVYSGHMPTNGTASVEQGGAKVNELTHSPRLRKPVELVLQSNANKSPIPGGGAFELRDSSDKVVWTGRADENGMLTIPYGSGNGQVLFEAGTQYTLKQTAVIGGYHQPEGSWKLTVSENYTIGPETIRPNGDNDSHTHDLGVQKGRFVILNDVDPYTPSSSSFTYNVYWVAKNTDGTVTAMSEKEARWWGYEYQDWVHTVEVKPGQGAAHINGLYNSSFWTPATLPTQKDEYANPPLNPPFQLCGFGIGQDYGTAYTDEDLKRIQNVRLEWECPQNQEKLNEGWGLGIEWIRETEQIQYFEMQSPNNHRLDEPLMGEMTAQKAVYIIYQDIRPVELTVRKVWQDRSEGKTHGSVTFTITPQGGKAVKNPDGGDTFTLNQENNWQMTLSVPRSGSYTVTETNVTRGYGVTYHTETLSDGTPSEITITNIEGAELPATGGPGTYLYTIGGAAILAVGLLYGLQLWRRREEAAE